MPVAVTFQCGSKLEIDEKNRNIDAVRALLDSGYPVDELVLDPAPPKPAVKKPGFLNQTWEVPTDLEPMPLYLAMFHNQFAIAELLVLTLAIPKRPLGFGANPMTRYFAVLLAMLCTIGIVRAQPKHGDFGSESLKVGAATREYRLVVPKSVDLAKPAPLVVAFHGMLIDSKDLMPVYTKLSEMATKHKFILAYPNAVGGSWGIAPDKVKADLAFYDALVAKISGDCKIDPSRHYVVGMSNGGYFAHLVGKERSKTVAAVASHSGPLGLQTLLGVKAERKFPVLIIHGDKDNILPVDWARENRDMYKKEGHEVRYVELSGAGHIWGTNENVNETIWSFFASHPLK